MRDALRAAFPVAQYRYRVNGRYVLTTTGFEFSDEDHYTANGWFGSIR